MSTRSESVSPGGRRKTLLGRKNLVVLGIAMATLVAGYLALSGGTATSLATVLLVVGYCILLPVAIAL